MFSVVGVLIVSSRPENGVGRLFCAIGLVNAAWIFTLGYAVRAVAGHANWLPAGQAAAWLDNVVSVPGQWLLLPVFFLFPTGRALSSRWLRLIWVGALAMAVGTVAAALEAGPVAQIRESKIRWGSRPCTGCSARSTFSSASCRLCWRRPGWPASLFASAEGTGWSAYSSSGSPTPLARLC